MALLTAAAALRIFLNNVPTYAPADELIYLRFAQIGYPGIIRLYLSDHSYWLFPSPLRWAFIGLASLFTRSFRDLTTLSTICGIATVALTYMLATKLFERRTALIATALVATSPLQLAMGRRALSDEFFCAVVLGSIVALVYDKVPIWIALTTFAFASKEQFLLTYPIVLLFWWLRDRKIRWIAWALPPFFYYAGFCLLARDATVFFEIAKATTSTMGAPYAAQFQSGPPQRLLIDLMAVAPLVTIAFIAAALNPHPPLRGTLSRTAGEAHDRLVLLLAGGILVAHSLLSSKNLRYVITADPLMRVLVATWLPDKRWTTFVLLANAAVELVIFNFVFVKAGVYDPVTHELLRALRMSV